MTYELWDIETSNLIGSFASQAEALALVAAFGSTEGSAAVDHLMLGWSAPSGDGGEIAFGHALFEFAENGSRRRS